MLLEQITYRISYKSSSIVASDFIFSDLEVQSGLHSIQTAINRTRCMVGLGHYYLMLLFYKLFLLFVVSVVQCMLKLLKSMTNVIRIIKCKQPLNIHVCLVIFFQYFLQNHLLSPFGSARRTSN